VFTALCVPGVTHWCDYIRFEPEDLALLEHKPSAAAEAAAAAAGLAACVLSQQHQ
jgi:hypothetical protein